MKKLLNLNFQNLKIKLSEDQEKLKFKIHKYAIDLVHVYHDCNNPNQNDFVN